jgi:Family of unknown function (DUF6629)
MCFSATASFVTASITATAGIAALIRVQKREEVALAAVPIFFAGQQAVEGLLWLTLSSLQHGVAVSTLATAFLIFAKVLWPVLVPAAALLVEPAPQRRRAMAVCLAMGVVVGIYFVWSILSYSISAHIGNEHIVYSGEPLAPLPIRIAYFVVVGLTAGLSSFLTLRYFAAIVFVGLVTSYIFYWEAFTSVWCFFAAAASAIIVLHFEQVRQVRYAERGQ